MSKVTLEGFILVPASDLEVVKQALVKHKQLTLEEPGCITFKVVENKRIRFVLMFMKSSRVKALLSNISIE